MSALLVSRAAAIRSFRRFPTLSAAAVAAVCCGLASADAAPSAAPGDPLVSIAHAGTWAAMPTEQQLEAAKPAGVSGPMMASLSQCNVLPDGRLQNCQVRASPDSASVKQAAERLLPYYRLEPDQARMAAQMEGSVYFTIGWNIGACAPPHCLTAPSVAPSKRGSDRAPGAPRR